jgi:hypothetical protein
MMSGSILLQRQRSLHDVQQLLAWYKIRDMLLGQNCVQRDIRKALDLASVCEHPNAVWLTTLFDGRAVTSRKEARRVFLGYENDARALCFASLLGTAEEYYDHIGRAAELGDACAQAVLGGQADEEECFRWAKQSAAQGERNGFYQLGHCYRDGIGCGKDTKRAKENFWDAIELGDVYAMAEYGSLLDKDDPQRFVWFGRAAAKRFPHSFLREMSDQIRNFNCGTGHARVVFVIGRALKGHVINNKKRTLFRRSYEFDACIGPANEALHFYKFQLRSCRKAVDSWTIVGLRNRVVKDIRKMIGKMIWDAREEAAFSLEQQSAGGLRQEKRARVGK